MPPRPHDDDGWILVQSRRGRRGGRFFEPDMSITSRHPRWSSRRSYADVARGEPRRRSTPPAFLHWRDYPDPEENLHAQRPRWYTRPSYQDGDHWVTTRGTGARAPPHRVQSDDPDFTQKVRVINRLIKAVHHLNNVSKEEDPPSLRRISQQLSTIIKPASPNSQTFSLIEGNAKNWVYTTILILREHYENSINVELNSLSQLSTGGWRGPFEIATCWAKRHLGARLKQETLDRCQRMLITRLSEPAPPSPSELTVEPEEDLSLELTPSSPPAAVRPPSTGPQSTAEARNRATKKTKKKHTERALPPLLEFTERSDAECSSSTSSPLHMSPLTPPPSGVKFTPAAEPSLISELQSSHAQRASRELNTEAPHFTPARHAANSAAAVQYSSSTTDCIPLRWNQIHSLFVQQRELMSNPIRGSALSVVIQQRGAPKTAAACAPVKQRH